MFQQTILYYWYPPFEPYIDNDNVTIIQRYLYAQPFRTKENTYGITFNIEEKCETEGDNKLIQFFRTLFTQTFEIDELPEAMHLSILALADNQVFGQTAEVFVQGLFTDLCIVMSKYKWIERYFPKWKELEDSKKNETMSELLKIQRSIRNGEFNDR